MRKNLLLGFALISMIGLLISCSKDTQPPSIEVLTGSGYYVAGTAVAPGAVVTVAVKATANTSSAENIKSIKVLRGDNSQFASEVFDAATITKEYTITALETAGTETITITATDNAGETAEVYVDIVTDEALAGTLKTNTIVLGAQNNTTGSFCASFEGTVYTVGELKGAGNYADIDIVYYYGDDNKSALFSPKAIVVADISWGGLLPVSNWTTINETKFKKAAATDFDNATYHSVATLGALADLDIANGGMAPIEGLGVGHAYAFKTADGKYGIFSVTAVTGTEDGTIALTIKIQDE
jgi:hypothetical protein